MDSMLVWIVVFAGAAIALLAVFLVASEKELKKKRAEIDDLLVKVGDLPAADSLSSPVSIAPDFDNEELNNLRARNQELENELAAISTNTEANQQFADDVERARRDVEIAKSNAQWLQDTNDELKNEIDELKKRLQASASSGAGTSAQPQGGSDREHELANDVADLQEQLTESRAKIREFEGMDHRLANVAAIEQTHRQEQQSLQTKIAELEQELAAKAEKIAEIDALRQSLAEAAATQQKVHEERNRFEQENARLKDRLSDFEDHSSRLSALRESFDQLLAKQATVEQHQREYQKAFANFTQIVATTNDGSHSKVTFNEFYSQKPAVESEGRVGAKDKPEGDHMSVAPNHIIATNQSAEKPKRMFGMFSVVVVFAFAGAVAVGIWSLKSSENTAPATVTASALPVRSQNQAPASVQSNPASTDSEPAATTDAPAAKPMSAPAVKEKTEPVKPVQAVKAEKPVTGTYEVTQTSRVYAGPSELSQAMGDIEPGVKVNVVNAKNGWLEIHSKHGRPPGFIRKEAARMVAQN